MGSLTWVYRLSPVVAQDCQQMRVRQNLMAVCITQAPNSRLILIGIANSIDLTERALPRLQALGCRPTLVTFPSYSSLQLECLLQQRLQALPGTVFQLQAVHLAAKKVLNH